MNQLYLLMVILLILVQPNATTSSFKIKEKITGEAGKDGTKNVEIMVALKYLSNF